MLINCEFCGTVYDTDKFSNCPNCHAASGKNVTVQQHVDFQNQANQHSIYSQMERDRYAVDAERFNAEQEYLETQRLKQRIQREQSNERISKGIRLGCAIPFIVVGLLFIAAIVFGIYSGLKEEGLFGDYEPNSSITETTEEEVVEDPQTVNVNETAVLSKYSVMCDRFVEINPYPWNTDGGCTTYEVRLVVENVSDAPIDFDEEIICVADGYQCDAWHTSPSALEKKFRGGLINEGLKINGSFVYDIPNDAEEVILKVGKYITIKLR